MPIDKIAGYAIPNVDADGQSPNPISDFQGKICIALEINHKSKSVLLLNPEQTALGAFDLDQIDRYFECRCFSGLLVPPDLNTFQTMEYIGRVFSYTQNLTRDMNFIKKMVIAASLHKGKFEDSIYFNFSN